MLIEFLWDKALYGRVTRPLLDFSERGLGTRLSMSLCPLASSSASVFIFSSPFSSSVCELYLLHGFAELLLPKQLLAMTLSTLACLYYYSFGEGEN